MRSHHLSRLLRASLLSAALAFPLLGAGDCAGITGAEDNYDGTYTLKSVSGTPLPYPIHYIDANNKLMLTSGSWTVNGSKLNTTMYTYMVVNGTRTPSSGSTPERHTGTITWSGDKATATLDNGTKVSATAGTGYLVTSAYGKSLRFTK